MLAAVVGVSRGAQEGVVQFVLLFYFVVLVVNLPAVVL